EFETAAAVRDRGLLLAGEHRWKTPRHGIAFGSPITTNEDALFHRFALRNCARHWRLIRRRFLKLFHFLLEARDTRVRFGGKNALTIFVLLGRSERAFPQAHLGVESVVARGEFRFLRSRLG